MEVLPSGVSKVISTDDLPNFEALENTCAKCGILAEKRCGNCHGVHYCSAEHQKEHWREHRKVCSPFTVKYSEQLGRYLVASRDLKERTLVIREEPFAFAPYDQPEDPSVPMCLGCCYRMSDTADKRCSTCHWPVCSRKCQEMSTHTLNECPILTKREVPYPPAQRSATYSSILILRLLLQKERSPQLWQAFLAMEHHTKLRVRKERCNFEDRMILENLREYVGESIDEEEIREIIGRVSVNSFGVSRREEGRNDDTVGRGVYLKTGIVAHSCVPNAVWGISYSPIFQIIVKTALPIKRGEAITPTYSDLWNTLGTYQRHSAMIERSHFTCKCRRCSDPTELGTYLSAIKCPKCPSGHLLPLDPLDSGDEAPWRCDDCGAGDVQRTIVDLVDDIHYEVEELIDELKGESTKQAVEKLEALYKKFCGTILHRNHFIVRSIQKALVERQYSDLDSCSFGHLDAFIFHCECLQRISDVLSPGYTGHGGALRGFLRDGMRQKKIKAMKEGCVLAVFGSSKSLDEYSRTIELLKREAMLHLENDPDSSPNGGTV